MYICTVGSRAELDSSDVVIIKQFGCFFCLVRLPDQALLQPCCSPGLHGCIYVNALFRVKSEVLYQTPKFSLFSVPCFAFWSSLGKQALDFSWMAINGERCSSSTASAAPSTCWLKSRGRKVQNGGAQLELEKMGPSPHPEGEHFWVGRLFTMNSKEFGKWAILFGWSKPSLSIEGLASALPLDWVLQPESHSAN